MVLLTKLTAGFRVSLIGAFDDLHCARPEQITLYPKAMDSEYKAVEDFFGPLSWSECDLRQLEQYRGDLSAAMIFMLPEAVQYFLPGFILAACDEGELQGDVLSAVLSVMEQGIRDEQFFECVFANYTDEQKRCLAKFLSLASHWEGDEATQEYVDPKEWTEALASLPPDVRRDYDRIEPELTEFLSNASIEDQPFGATPQWLLEKHWNRYLP